MTTCWPALSPLTISVEVSPFRPATTGSSVCLPFATTVTRAFEPLPVTAADGTFRTLSRSATVTLTLADIPGFSFGSLRSSANVTLYSTTLDEVVPVRSTPITCAASSSAGSAETVTVAGWPTAMFATSLSLNAAETCRSCRPISVTKPDDDDELELPVPLPLPVADDDDEADDDATARPAARRGAADHAVDGGDGARDRCAQRRLRQRAAGRSPA